MIEFLKTVLPHAVDLVRDLFHMTKGDTDKAIRYIRDRRSEIDKMWDKHDDALQKKHEDDTRQT
jgi:hypothetical protein